MCITKNKISDMRNRTVSIVCMLLCLLGISRVSFAQQEDNLLRREYQVAMEEHVQNMIAALSMYSSDIYYENESVLRTRRVKLIRVFFRSEQAKMYDFLKIGVETQDNYLDVMEFLRTIPVVLPRVTFNMSVEEISPYVRLASGEFKLPVKIAITFVDLTRIKREQCRQGCITCTTGSQKMVILLYPRWICCGNSNRRWSGTRVTRGVDRTRR